MLKIYGSMLCRDCVQCREDLDAAGAAYFCEKTEEIVGKIEDIIHGQ